MIEDEAEYVVSVDTHPLQRSRLFNRVDALKKNVRGLFAHSVVEYSLSYLFPSLSKAESKQGAVKHQ